MHGLRIEMEVQPSSWWDSNPQPFCHEACALPLSCNLCPIIKFDLDFCVTDQLEKHQKNAKQHFVSFDSILLQIRVSAFLFTVCLLSRRGRLELPSWVLDCLAQSRGTNATIVH